MKYTNLPSGDQRASVGPVMAPNIRTGCGSLVVGITQRVAERLFSARFVTLTPYRTRVPSGETCGPEIRSSMTRSRGVNARWGAPAAAAVDREIANAIEVLTQRTAAFIGQ